MLKSSNTAVASLVRGIVLASLLLAGVIVIAGPLLAQNDVEKSEPKAAPIKTEKDAAATPANPVITTPIGPNAARNHIEAQLATPTKCNFTDTPLSEALQFFGHLHNCNVLLDKSKLEEVAVAHDTPLTVEFSGITLASALNIMLEPLQLTYVIEDEVLKVTSRDAADNRYEVRIYDVKGLAIAGITPQDISDAITLAISGAKWRTKDKAGGGAVVVIADALLINQTQPVHRKIVKLIEQLELLAKIRPGSVPLNKGLPDPTY